jgi:DNA-binding transcriptional LysR family regulator
MITGDVFTGLAAVLAVAETKSFTAAAARLGVSAAAVSQTVKEVERRLGTPLFARTTRRVGLTEAGQAFLARVRPAVTEIAAATEAAGAMGDRPVGRLRLTVPRIALDLVVAPVLAAFHKAYPEVTVEVAVDDTAVDLAAQGFDAGIRIGEMIERDMIAVKLTRPFRWIVVGSPAYFARHGRPATPEALAGQACIAYRFPGSGALYRWEFVRAGRDFTVAAHGPIIVNDGGLAVDCALRGLGLSYNADLVVAPHLEAGRLEAVLKPFAPESPGFHLYFPNRAQAQPKLRAFIDVARRVLAR